MQFCYIDRANFLSDAQLLPLESCQPTLVYTRTGMYTDGYHAINIKYERPLTKVDAQLCTRPLHAYRGVEFDIFEMPKCVA